MLRSQCSKLVIKPMKHTNDFTCSLLVQLFCCNVTNYWRNEREKEREQQHKSLMLWQKQLNSLSVIQFNDKSSLPRSIKLSWEAKMKDFLKEFLKFWVCVCVWSMWKQLTSSSLKLLNKLLLWERRKNSWRRSEKWMKRNTGEINFVLHY